MPRPTASRAGPPHSLARIGARAWAMAQAAGVTRLADATGYDRVGIPVWQAVRPQSRSLTVSQGKGASAAVAALSALMESLEFHHVESVPADAARAATAEDCALWNRHLPEGTALPRDRAIGWLEGQDLLGACPAAVPHSLVLMDCARPNREGWAVNTTGVGAGADDEAAKAKGALELLERFGLAAFNAARGRQRRTHEIDPAALPGRRAGWAIARLARAGLELRAWDMSAAVGLPTVIVVVLDGDGPLDLPPVVGACCHPAPEAAAFGALVEAAQARVTTLAGARDDMPREDYAGHARRTLGFLVESASLTASGKLPRWPEPPRTPPLEAALAALDGLGVPAVIGVRLAAPDAGLSFWKLLAPGLADGERDLSARKKRPANP